MNIEKFINNNKLLCGLTLGLAVVGYILGKTVKWVLIKTGIISKIDKAAQEIFLQTPPPKEEHLQIVHSPKTIQDYLNAEYKGNTERTVKYRTRLESIGKHYYKETIYPVRGDGNCFCNAAVAGLLSIPDKKGAISTILRDEQNASTDYITPDPIPSAAEHLKIFTKGNDFALVISQLESERTPQNLLEDFDFTAAFSRILRYLLSSRNDDCSKVNGEEVDMNAIWTLNAIFKVDIKGVVLSGPSWADKENPYDVYTFQNDFSERAWFRSLIADRRPIHHPEFVIIRKDAHFIALT